MLIEDNDKQFVISEERLTNHEKILKRKVFTCNGMCNEREFLGFLVAHDSYHPVTQLSR